MRTALRTSMLFATTMLSATAYAQSDSDKAAIQQVVQTESDAWNRGDAKAFAAPFAEDGSFTNIVGMQTYGRAPFEKQHQIIFTTIYKGTHNELTIGHLHFVRQDVAIADVDAVLSKIPNVPSWVLLESDGALHTKLQLVLSKNNGTWQIDAFHNVPVNPAAIQGQPKPMSSPPQP